MNNELLDIFSHKLLADLPHMKEQVSTLQTDAVSSISKLFRSFHNYKASSSYLGLHDMNILVSHGENILSALRTNNEIPREIDVKWMHTCVSQLQIWCDELIAGEALSKADHSLFPTICIINDLDKTSDIMLSLNVLYADVNEERSKKIKAPLSHIFKNVTICSDVNKIKDDVRNNISDLVILNMQKDSIQLAQELLALKPDLAIITAVPELRVQQKSRLMLKGLTHPISSPIKSSELKRQLHNLVTSHFSKVFSLVSHKKIYNFIQGIDPLSSSVKEITRLCDDPESSLKDLIKTVQSDSITSATVLHAASLPIYAVKKTSSVEKAIISFGKRLVKALTLSDLACKIGSLQLDAYNISEKQFKQCSQMRLALMNAWYSHVNITDLDILCASAVLGNLGEILIDQEIIKEGLQEEFKKYEEHELSMAEVTLLKTSTAFVTSDILNFWGLEDDLVDSIRYSDSPFNASTKRIQELSCANYVVYQMVTPYGELHKEIPMNVQALMKKAKLDENVLKEAIEALYNQDLG